MMVVKGLFCFFLLLVFGSATEIFETTENLESLREISQFEEILEENVLAVLFTQECCTCTECVEAEVLLGGMSKELEENLGILVVRLKEPALRSRYGIKKIPALAYIRDNKTAIYEGKFEFDELYMWFQDNRNPLTVDLDDTNFEHFTQAATGATTGDWLVLFHDGTCCKNRELIHLETAGIRLKNRVNVGSVHTLEAPETAERFKLTSCPHVIFFRHMKMYRLSLPDITSTTLRRFAEGFYKNSKAEKVEFPPTFFDKFTDMTIQFYKENFLSVVAGMIVSTLVFVAFIIM